MLSDTSAAGVQYLEFLCLPPDNDTPVEATMSHRPSFVFFSDVRCDGYPRVRQPDRKPARPLHHLHGIQEQCTFHAAGSCKRRGQRIGRFRLQVNAHRTLEFSTKWQRQQQSGLAFLCTRFHPTIPKTMVDRPCFIVMKGVFGQNFARFAVLKEDMFFGKVYMRSGVWNEDAI